MLGIEKKNSVDVPNYIFHKYYFSGSLAVTRGETKSIILGAYLHLIVSNVATIFDVE
jgi:hypothetical protein